MSKENTRGTVRMNIKISSWQEWKELCKRYDIDPYENADFGIDLGGGRSRDFEFVGDVPKKEA